MPIKIPNKLPAKEILQQERIFVMDKSRAIKQDIRELKIAVLNLMPLKKDTEVQLLRLIGNSPLQVEITLLHPRTHISKNTSKEYLLAFYKTFEQIKEEKFDGMIITGAPIEKLRFEEVNYWEELKQIMEWTKTNVTSTLHICWGAQAGLYYHYGVEKKLLESKMFGVFEHHIICHDEKITQGFDDNIYIPHSRYTGVDEDKILQSSKLKSIAISKQAGTALVISNIGKQIFAMGHSEYDRNTLKNEYKRDIDKGLSVNIPQNYFEDDDFNNEPKVRWRAHANLLISNWLNYYVYQATPYKL